MKADKVEINFIRGNHVVNTIEIEPADISVINEALKIAYNSLSQKYIDCVTGGFKSISESIVQYEGKVKELIGKIHE